MKARGITISVILILLVIPVTLCAWGFLLPACYSETFMGELPEKVRLLDETEGRRIVVVGGSAAAFGIDSDYVGRELDGYTAVNFGMYAGLGTRAMLDLSLRSLRDGDLVVVMPEQQEQSLSDYFGAEYFWQAADGNVGLLTRLSRDDLLACIGEFPAFAADKFRYVSAGEMPEADAVYRKGSFAENGDIRDGVATANRMPGGFDVNTPILFEEGMVSEAFAGILNDYAEAAAARGAMVYYHFPPMNAEAVRFADAANADAEMQSHTAALARQITCPILGDPRDSIMESGYFFDTNFHLTDEGRRIFSRQLVRDIKAALGDFSKTGLPDTEEGTDSEMPGAFAEDAEPRGEMSETSGAFIFEVREGACVLTGLGQGEAGKAEIHVPSVYEGYPVEMIAASAFAGRGSVQRIILPESVRMMEDYAFDGCDALREIVMESGEPEKCAVGQHLLDGTRAVVLVPAASLSAYRLNYNWSVWADRIEKYE